MGSGDIPPLTCHSAVHANRQKAAIANTIGGPVNLETTHENAAPNFGTGMAPFFLTLALFFGALVLWMVLRPLQNRAIAAEVLPIRVALSSYRPAAVIGIVQAVILYGVVRFALGMHAAHPVAMLAFMILVSCAFVAATQAINALVGPAVGRVLMAICMLEGIWQDAMRLPLPGRILLVERDGHRWLLDERGYPVPSEVLIQEVQRLREREKNVKSIRLDRRRHRLSRHAVMYR